MKYLACVMRVAIFVFGLYMVCMFPDMMKPPFISGITFMLIALYLQLFVKSCTCSCAKCDKKKDKKPKKDKKKHKKHKKDKYEGNY